MSDATLQAVHDAVAAHVADESGGTDWLTEWVCIAVAIPQDDYEQCMYYRLSPKQPYHHSVGLLQRGMELLTKRDD
ncbi:hypothetical protein FDI41_gp67 [Arthrobacter phage Piccoletto]|uniref:Uncharacterized protein n=1 Tax=Arthrobacter phage Piccoletto TaxID=2024282 RepID=A0A222Z9N2_9CAUD|nr:hypothetical protein FDI41_gp67 [Arthrobacter phage Piccoletto]ASR80697.1 hypothetical protein SEA_PICCOLETTO_67 [Arthrobacter phage Piccoletto]UVK62318.1 hypothetical protein SEA_NATHANVAAG_66 [Arthrobacter phage NathanVaag]